MANQLLEELFELENEYKQFLQNYNEEELEGGKSCISNGRIWNG